MLLETINMNRKMMKPNQSLGYKIGEFFLTILYFCFIAFNREIAAGLLLASLALVACIACNRVFCDSLYKDQAGLYMSLPISNAIIIWGKVLACVWEVMTFLVYMIGAIFFIVFYWIFSGEVVADIVEHFAYYLVGEGITPMESAIVIGLRPVQGLLVTAAIALFVMTAQRLLSKMGRKSDRAYIVIIAMAVGAGAAVAGCKLATTLETMGVNVWIVESVGTGILMAIILVLYAYVKKELDLNYNLG